MNKTRFLNKLLTTTVFCSAMGIAAPAFAQDMAQEEAEPGTSATVSNSDASNADAEGDAIVVTGSRIPQPNLTGASPVTVVNSQEVKLQGITRTEDLINSLPQVFAGQGGNIANGATGTATINLRGLGAQRTLVLVNGRRLLPGDTNSSAADINIIPAALIDRVDVLTGGASSVYGSDAISGVVNFILDTDFEGVKLDAQYGFYQHQNDAADRVINALNSASAGRGFPYPSGSVADGGTFEITGVIGAGFDDGRGHVTAYAGYRKINQILQRDRDYGSCTLAANSTAAVAGGANEFSCSGSGGSATGTFLTNVGTFTVGPNRTFVGSNATTNPPFNFGPYNHFQRPDERYVLGAFADYEISEAVKPYFEVMFMDDRTVAQIAPTGTFNNVTSLNCDNPLLSAQQLAIVCSPANLVDADQDGVPDVFVDNQGNAYTRGVAYINRRNVEGGGRISDIQHTDFRIVGGVKGDISSAWSYDAYYQFGRVTNPSISQRDASIVRLDRATDVVTSPTTGLPVCRSTLDGTDPACVPYDIFGAGGVTPAAINYIQAPFITRGITEESVASASLTGTLGEYGIQSPWANEGLGVNLGLEYRKESLDFQPDLASINGDASGAGGASTPVSGSFDVRELYAEARLPIVQDSFLHEVVVSAGYRYSKYENAQNQFSTDTYKIEGEIAPVRDIRIRGGYNRAVRAPNVVELFSPQNVVLVGTTDPCDGTPELTAAQCAFTGVSAAQFGNIPENPAGQYNGQTGGNPLLDPEVADTYTVGVVLTPTFLPGFSASVDYFDIKLDGAVSALNPDVTLQTCGETGDPFLCSLINRDARGSLWLSSAGFVEATNQNIGSLSTTGIDFNVAYGTEIGSLGSISASITGTFLDELITDDSINVPYDCTGLYGNVCGTPNPEYRHKARITWTTPDDIGLSVQWRHFDSVAQDTTSEQEALAGVSQPAHDRLSSQDYIDLSASFRIGDNYNFRLGVNNVFDSGPPLVGSQACPAVICANTYAQVYDTNGRYIFAGVTLDF